MLDSSLIDWLRRSIRDALPAPLGRCLTLRANPLLGFFFRFWRKSFRIEGMVFEVPLVGQPWHSLATYWFDDYEKPEREFCRNLIRCDDRICELGGCLGVVSMVINRRLGTPNLHLVVEANPNLIPLIERNRSRNGGQFTLLHAAAGNGDALEMDLGSGLLTSSGLADARDRTAVQGVTLDELWHLHGPFNVLVMDIEGAEKMVLQECFDSWKSCRLIIVEWHPSLISQESVDEACERLQRHGFQRVDRRAGCLHVVEAWQRPDPS